MYILHIGNKNYSSWSLRPWLLLKALDIPFDERLNRFEELDNWSRFREFSPNGKVPCLVDGDSVVWDSLAIVEYLAERHPGVWPADAAARSWARCATAEMHAGFAELRQICTMNCGVSIRLHGVSASLQRDLRRIDELLAEGLSRSGGPWLAGVAMGAVDAFYAPVAFRWQTYQFDVSTLVADYFQRLLAMPAMVEWYQAALQEPWRDDAHEREAHEVGVVVEDRRAQAAAPG